MDVSDGHVIKIEELLVVEIIGVLLEFRDPELEVGQHLPVVAPGLLQLAAWWVLEVQTQQEGVRCLVVLGDDIGVVYHVVEEGLREGVLGVALDVLAVAKVKLLLGLELFEDSLELVQDEAPLEFRNIGVDERVIFTLLLLPEAG